MNETLRVLTAHSREGHGLYSCAKRRGREIPHRGWPSRAMINLTGRYTGIVGIAHRISRAKGLDWQ
jgi:hypothetical protein